MRAVARTDVDLRHLIIDELHELRRYLSSGMSYEEIVNTLLERVPPSRLLAALEQTFPGPVAEHRHLLLNRSSPESIRLPRIPRIWLIGLLLIGASIVGVGLTYAPYRQHRTAPAPVVQDIRHQARPPILATTPADAIPPPPLNATQKGNEAVPSAALTTPFVPLTIRRQQPQSDSVEPPRLHTQQPSSRRSRPATKFDPSSP